MFGIISDLVKVVAAPLVVAESVARVVTKPVADLATEVAQEVKSSIDEVIK